jgi:serine/threonine protein kinase
MGQVYKGVHPAIGSRVAIKVLSGDLARHASLVERFFSEARAVNVIRHENIVNVLDLAWLPDGRPYIVMEFLDGAPLSAVIRGRGALPLGSLVTLIREVLDALAAAHDSGIIHRDLKPDNIFVTPGGRAKVLDFGIAKLRPDVSQAQGATETGSILGTPHYMSPEQALGRAVDPRSDLYAVGIILFEGAAGRLPFVGDSLFELLKQHVEAPPPPLHSIRQDVPAALVGVIGRALEKDPARRFGSARELAAALLELERLLPPESFLSLGTRGVTGAPFSAPPRITGESPAGASLGYVTGSSYGGTTGYAVTGHGDTTVLGRKSGSWAFAVAGLAALLLLGAAATLVIAVVALRVLRAESGSATGAPQSAPAEKDPTSRASSPSIPRANGGWDPSPPFWGQQPSGWDPKRITVDERLLEGARLAKKQMPDAELVRIDVTGVSRDGRVNLEVNGDTDSMFLARWRSPSLSRRPADLPVGAKQKAPCLFYYMINEMGISAYTVDHMGCEEKTVPTPTCTIKQVLARAESQGAPRTAYIADVSYYAFGQAPARWYVRVGAFSRFMDDDCGR